MRNLASRSLIKAFVVIGFLGTVTVVYTIYSVFYAKMPADGMHRSAGSNFECLGCHNRARAGGNSFVYHFKKYKCRKCHLE